MFRSRSTWDPGAFVKMLQLLLGLEGAPVDREAKEADSCDRDSNHVS